MVTKTSRELAEMQRMIDQGLLPRDAIDQHYENEYTQTFGQNYKTDADGNPIEQGRGSKAQPTEGSIQAYIKNQTERRHGGPEKDFEKHLQDMRDNLAAFQSKQPQPQGKRRPGRPAKVA